MTKIRVGILSKPSETITINKPFEDIKLKDIHEQIGNKHVLGWCPLLKENYHSKNL